jgi:hypothetical protein
MRFSQRRLGIGLWVERLIANRIGGAKWRDRVRLAEQAIHNRHLK